MRRWQVVVLWLVAFLVIPFALSALGFSERLIQYALYGAVFGALAHLSKSQYWQYLKNKELNPLSKRFGESSVPRPVEAPPTPLPPRLNTPAKRLWFLAMIVGLVIVGSTYAVFAWQHPYRDFLRVFDYPYNYGGYKVALVVGALLAILGLFFSFFHERSLGKLIQWVRGGGGTP